MDFTHKPDEIPINCKSMGPFKRNCGFSPDNVTSDTTNAHSYETTVENLPYHKEIESKL